MRVEREKEDWNRRLAHLLLISKQDLSPSFRIWAFYRFWSSKKTSDKRNSKSNLERNLLGKQSQDQVREIRNEQRSAFRTATLDWYKEIQSRSHLFSLLIFSCNAHQLALHTESIKLLPLPSLRFYIFLFRFLGSTWLSWFVVFVIDYVEPWNGTWKELEKGVKRRSVNFKNIELIKVDSLTVIHGSESWLWIASRYRDFKFKIRSITNGAWYSERASLDLIRPPLELPIDSTIQKSCSSFLSSKLSPATHWTSTGTRPSSCERRPACKGSIPTLRNLGWVWDPLLKLLPVQFHSRAIPRIGLERW